MTPTRRQRGDGRSKVTADNYFAIVPEWVLYADVSAQAVRLYAVLNRIANDDTGKGHAKRSTLAERLKVRDASSAWTPVSLKTVDRALAELEAIDAIEVMPQFDDAGDRKENLYKVRTAAPTTGEGVASSMSPPLDIDDPTGRHQCRDGGVINVATVASSMSQQGNQSPGTRAHEPESSRTSTCTLALRSPSEAQAEDGLAALIDTRAAQLLALLATRLDPPSLVDRLYEPRDAGCRIVLGRRLAELERAGWPDDALTVELAGAVYRPGEISSVAGLLLHRARALGAVVPAHSSAWWDATTTSRAPGSPSSPALLAAAQAHGRNLAHAGIAYDDIAYELVDQYRPTIDQLVAALTGAGLYEHGHPTELATAIDVHTRELLDATLARGGAA